MPLAKSRQEKLAAMRQEALGEFPAPTDKAGQRKVAVQPDDASSTQSVGPASARQASRPGGKASPEAAAVAGAVQPTPQQGDGEINWATVDKIAAVAQERDAEKARRNKKELQERFRSDLEKQVQDRQIQQEREKQRDARFHEEIMKSYEAWRETEEAKVTQKREKTHGTLGQLREHIDKNKERRENVIKAEKAEALAFAQLTKQKSDEDEQARALQEAKKRAEYKAILQANQATKADRVKALGAKEGDEMSKQVLYQQQTEARKKMVEEAKAAKVDQRQRISESMGGAQAANERALQQEAVQKALAERKAIDAINIAKENEKKTRLQQDRVDIQQHQINQMAQKQKAKQAELDYKKVIGSQLSEDTLAFKEEMKLKSDSTRNRNMQFRGELEKQIEAKHQAVMIKKDQMTDTELRINKRLLENAQQILNNGSMSAR